MEQSSYPSDHQDHQPMMDPQSSRRRNRVRELREDKLMTQAQLASRMDVSRQSVASTEEAELDGSATLSRIQRVADALGLEPETFVEEWGRVT